MRGRVEAVGEEHVLLRVGPAVMRLLVPSYFLRRLDPGRSVELPVHLHLQMEGNRVVPIVVAFPTHADRSFFESFISVSGVGVRAAVKALARPPAEIGSAIAAGDHGFLTTLPGIGGKRSKQIVAGLQDRMAGEYGPAGAGVLTGGAAGEAAAVLTQLGLTRTEAEQCLRRAVDALGDEADASELVREAMRGRGG